MTAHWLIAKIHSTLSGDNAFLSHQLWEKCIPNNTRPSSVLCVIVKAQGLGQCVTGAQAIRLW